jgi:hypothetical protein
MLTALLARVSELLGGPALPEGEAGSAPRKKAKGDASDAKPALNGRLPRGLRGLTLPPLVPKLLAARGAGMTVAEYTSLDDPMMYYAISELARAADPVAGELARRLLGRGLFKASEVDVRALYPPQQPGRRGRASGAAQRLRPEAAEKLEAARELVRRAGYDDRYFFLQIESSDTPYRPYDPTKHQQKNIVIESPSGHGYQDISEVSEIVRALQASNYNLVRFVYPATDPAGGDLRGPIEELLGGLEAGDAAGSEAGGGDGFGGANPPAGSQPS